MEAKQALLNNQKITKVNKEKIKKIPRNKWQWNTTTQNLWDAAKAVPRGKFIGIQSQLKKQETSQINKLTLHLKQLEKEEQKNAKVSRKKERNKDQIRNKWNRDEENNRKDQWN